MIGHIVQYDRPLLHRRNPHYDGSRNLGLLPEHRQEVDPPSVCACACEGARRFQGLLPFGHSISVLSRHGQWVVVSQHRRLTSIQGVEDIHL